MPPEQTSNGLNIQTESEMDIEEDTNDEETYDLSSTTKTDKTRKITHSEIERRRREKMNRYIDEIAQLLPIDAVKKLDKLTVLRAAVDTIKHLKGTSSKVSSTGFGKQIYLNDTELLELTLATIDQLGTYFFLIIECQKGQICYASSSTETILGYKPIELCVQSIFDIVHSDDIEVIRQQFINEKKPSAINTEDLSNDSKSIPLLTTKQNCLEIGNRRTFSCRINSKTKRSNKTTTTTTTNSVGTDNFLTIDFVGYMKQYSLTDDNENEIKTRTDRRHSNLNTLTPTDVLNAIGTTPVSCLIAMGNLIKSNPIHENLNTIDRMFLCKLNPDGQFTYFDQICYSVLGYLSQDLLGMSFKDFIHEDDQNKFTEIWNRVYRDHQIGTTGNYRFRTKDKKYITLQTIFEPFINPWNDELEIVVARNKIKGKSTPTPSTKNSRSRIVNNNSLSALYSSELIRQLLP